MNQTVVLLGPEGSFSDAALKKMKFKAAGKKYADTLKEVFKNAGKEFFGFVPVKNKLVGPIKTAVSVFDESKWKIVEKIRMPVKFILAAPEKMELAEIKNLYCASIAKKQCKNFIRKSLKNAKIISNFASTSAAFKKIVQKKRIAAAAIGSRAAAKIYKFKILASGIQDDKNDWTEFVLFRGL